MGWTLRSNRTQTQISAQRVALGRADFPQDKMISHAHVEFFIENERLFARDLKSANGTYLRGKLLQPEVTAEVHAGDSLQIGQTLLVAAVAEEAEDSGVDNPWPKLALVVFAVLALLSFANPSMAFGRSIGLFFSLVTVFILLASTALVALPLAAVFMQLTPSFRRNFSFVLLVAVGGSFAYSLIVNAVEEQWPFAHTVLAHKVEYFCLRKFNPTQCAHQVNHCPACMVAIDKWARTQMVANLRPLRSQYPPVMQNEGHTREPAQNTR